jgi:putative DNA primase/helicase
MIAFKPTHSLVLLTNYRPAGNSQDRALWARILSVRFPYSFVDNPLKENERQRDSNLLEELKAEGPGILSWLVDGFYAYREKGLAPPPSIQAETDEYRKSDDSIQHFITEKCAEGPECSGRAQELFESYEEFCSESGFKVKGKRAFFQRLQEQYIKEKDKNGKYYKGLCLKTPIV